MTLLPADPLVSGVNYDSVVLQIGSNPDSYTMLEGFIFHLERPELPRYKTGTTSSPQILKLTLIGIADSWFEGTLLMSLSEYITFATTYFNLDSHRQVPIEYFKIVMTDFSGTTKTIGNTGNTPTGFKGRVSQVECIKPNDPGPSEYRIRVKLLEDTVTIT